jgi:hypothetical protein
MRGECERTLEVGHEGFGATVQGIDDHLAVRGTRDFDSAVFQARGRWSADPGGITPDVVTLPQEFELFSRVEALLNGIAST